MKWAWRIATVAGIGIDLHGTFLLLVGFVLISEWSVSRSVTAALGGALFVLAIFATVVLHELGHALTAMRYGIRTRDITLLPIGGIARLERTPEVPRQEFWVALAGPAVNLAIAAVCFGVLWILPGATTSLTIAPTGDGVLNRFMTVNLVIAGFNLLPAFPMDGGRALRALLAERMDYVRATEMAASLGQGLAMVFGFVGLFANPFLLFIALFVWMGASGEAATVSLRTALSGIPVERAMITEFHTVEAHQPIRVAADLLLAGAQQDFPVVDGDRLVGVLARDRLLHALANGGLDAPVQGVMVTAFETADAREMLEPAFQRLQGGQCPLVPVLRNGSLVGILTAENVGEFVMVRNALGSNQRS